MYRSHYLFCCFLFLFFSACDTTQAVVQSFSEPIRFTILQINDVYEIAPLEGGKAGGLARVASVLRQLEQENPNTIAVLAGDFLSPSFMGNLKMKDGERIAGLQMVETLNAMGLDFATFGNHEFDLKTGTLLEKRLDQSDFLYCGANAFHQLEDSRRPFMQKGVPVPEYVTFPVVQGNQTIQVALVGIVLPFNQTDYVHYTDVEASFRTAVGNAHKQADVVLGLTHLSIDGDEALAEAVPGLPLFMGGHEHHHLSRYVGETAITKADANAKTVYIHRISYYPDNKVCRVVSDLVPITDQLEEDATTAAVVQKWQDQLGGLVKDMGYDLDQQLTTLDEPLIGSEGPTRSSQTNYGLLTNKAIATAWPGADAYIFNSGSLRIDDDISGTITAYDVLRSFPYGGPLVRMKITGTDLKNLLSTGDATNKGEGGYLQRYLAEGAGNNWQINGEALDNSREYVIVLPQFVAQGREANMGFLAEIPHLTQETFEMYGQTVKNDIRDIVIAYLASGSQ